MKHYLAILCSLLIVDWLSMNAENITVSVEHMNYSTFEYFEDQSFTTELSRDEDGVYTIKNFLNSDHQVSFTFNNLDINEMGPIRMCGNVFINPNTSYAYLMTKDNFELDSDGFPSNSDDYMVCSAYSSEGVPTLLLQPFVDDLGSYNSSYIVRLDPESEVEDYYAVIVLSATLENGEAADWYFISFKFKADASVKVYQVESNSKECEYFNLNGVRVDNPYNGMYICKQGNITRKVIID